MGIDDLLRSAIKSIVEVELTPEERDRLREAMKGKGLTLRQQLDMVTDAAMKDWKEPDWMGGKKSV